MKIYVNTKFKPKILVNGKMFYCQIGVNGTVPQFKKKEGDKSTPTGKWKIKRIFFRKDRNKNIFSSYFKNKIIEVNSNLVWCDDVKSNFYNRLVNLKNLKRIKFSYEALYRLDNAYDIFIEINYNQAPIIRSKGSAIFIHCSFDDFRSTLGCVALKKNNMKYLINNLQKLNYIYIR